MTTEPEVKDAAALVGELKSEVEPDVSATRSRVIDVQSEEHFNAVLKNSRGAVLVDFTQQGCEACEGEKPILEKLSNTCDDVTVLHVDSDKLPDLADKFKVDGTPTLLYAKSGKAMTPRKAEEVEPDDELRRRLKCAR